MEQENNWRGYLPAAGYQEFKGLVDKELNQAAEGFVRIGYLLKVARDTNILYESVGVSFPVFVIMITTLSHPFSNARLYGMESTRLPSI